MVYDFNRVNKGPTLYGENKTPFLADVVEGGLAFCAVILFFSFLLIVPGIRGKEKLYAVIRVTFLMFVGTVILVSLFAQSWEVGTISGTTTQYKAGIKNPVKVDVGLYIGLRGINVTLKSNTTKVTELYDETINYNEHYSWEWTQGRLGFGPFAGRFNREFRESQRRGTPYPILWVAEYFTVDGEGIRWGRFYRLAGWYSHIVLWLAFSFLIVSAIMTYVLIRYATYTLAVCGFCTTLANILFASIRNPNALIIQFPGKQLTLAWGWTFVLNIIAGVLTLVVAIVLFVIDLRRPSLLMIFFGIDSLQDADEESDALPDDNPSVRFTNSHIYKARNKLRSADADEEVKMMEDKVIESADAPSTVNGDIPGESDNEDGDDDAPVVEAPKRTVAPPKYVSHENRMTKIFKQNRRSVAPPPARPRRQFQVHEQTVYDEIEDYENMDIIAKSGQQDLAMKELPNRRYQKQRL